MTGASSGRDGETFGVGVAVRVVWAVRIDWGAGQQGPTVVENKNRGEKKTKTTSFITIGLHSKIHLFIHLHVLINQNKHKRERGGTGH